MGKTNAQKTKERDGRLQQLPRKARFAKSAEIKRKEGRVLDANEKRAIKMKGNHGAIMRAWEVLRASADKVEEKLEAMRSQAKMQGAVDSEDNAATNKHMLVKEDFVKASGNREAAVTKVLALIEPKFDEIAKTPTCSRVIQSCIKFGTNEQRTKILLLLTPNYTSYCTDGFAHFAIEALIRHATKGDFKALLSLTLNAMNTLATHKCGIRVVNALYNHKLASTTEKNMMVLGVFKDSVSVMKGWAGYPVVEDMLPHLPDAQHRRMLNVLFDAADKLISQKEAFEYPFAQRLLCAVFARGAKEQVEELSATVKSYIVKMALTRDGARLASVAMGVLPPRSRKVVLQDVAAIFDSLAMEKYSPPFIARCFDLTYDPQMAQKFLIAPLIASIGPISGSPYGCRILLHLLTPDAERKAKVMLAGYEDHNLYSRGNAKWNHHTWRTDATLEEETVEICPRPAEQSHLAAIGPIMQAFVETVCKVDGLDANKTLKGFVARIAAEAIHMNDSEPKYRAAMGLSKEQLDILRTLMSNKVRKEEEEAAGGAPVAAKQVFVNGPKRKSTGKGTAAATEAVATTPKAAAKAPVVDATVEVVAESGSAKKAGKAARRQEAAAAAATTPRALKSSRAEEQSVVLEMDGDDEDVLVETSAHVAPKGGPASPVAVGTARKSAKASLTPARTSKGPKAAAGSATKEAAKASSTTPSRPSAGKKAARPSGGAKSAADALNRL